MIQYQINLVTIPLSRHHYKFDDLRKGQNKITGQSGLLMENFLKFQSEEGESFNYSEMNNESMQTQASSFTEDNHQNLHPDNIEATSDVINEDTTSVNESKKTRIRKINRKKFSLFEEINEEEKNKEQELLDLINQDSYYDVIEPYDSEKIELTSTKRNTTLIIILVGVLVVSIVGIVGMIGSVL